METSNKTKFWVVVAFWLFGLIICLVCGCKPDKPSRLATQIVCGSDGIREGWFAYAMTTGDVIEQEGLGMDFERRKNVYLKNNGCGGIEMVEVPASIQEVQSNGITGPGGRLIVKGKRLDFANYQGRVIYSQGWVSSAGMSGAFMDYGTIVKPLREQASAQYNSVLSKYYAKSSLLSLSEKGSLCAPTSSPPISGISCSELTLLQQQGGLGEGFPKEMNNGFMAGNLIDAEKYLRYASPFMFSVTFKTPEPADIIGTQISATIKTDAFPSGITVDVAIIASNTDKMTHVARTAYFLPVDSTIQVPPEVSVYDRWTPFPDPNIWDSNQYVRSVKEDWLDIIDPNLWNDPNTCPDPNVLFDPHNPDLFNFTSRLDTSADNFGTILIPSRIHQVKTIPLGAEGDNLDIDINCSDSRLIMLIAPNWLTGNKIYDRNGDGVVNMKDLP
jgi:hypothetical protein